MADIDARLVMKLRQQTGAPMMDCKAALTESGGDLEKAVDVLRKRGLKAADTKTDRVATEGTVFSYTHHGGKIGVLVEVACETDFVARNEEFQAFGKDLCLHVTFAKPRFLTREEVDPTLAGKEREIATEQAKAAMKGKPDPVVQKAVDGKMETWYATVCLLDQPFVKDEAMTVAMVTKQLISKTGENIKIRRFARFELGA
jgi:elongation factor Ts